ncbi:MAG: plasmid mobilization relaxosome protein MobC [Parvularcula sp.]|jgi:hypothetical protein|nr:plasmid mobilization relaxosome protein MobC [Parvularcula sp.]
MSGGDKKKPATSPFSIRLTSEERARLEAQAGAQPLGRYMRNRLLESDASPRKAQSRPSVDSAKVAAALANLGQSRLASNLNQLAKAANIGTLPVTEDVAADLSAACRDVAIMRSALLEALGLSSGERP